MKAEGDLHVEAKLGVTRVEMDPVRIGRRLRFTREALGLRPSQMADLLGIERTYWTRYEKGHRKISYEVGALMVAHFGVTLDFIFLGNLAGVPLDLAQRIRKAEEQVDDT